MEIYFKTTMHQAINKTANTWEKLEHTFLEIYNSRKYFKKVLDNFYLPLDL
jgi:hypothetical protein